jgi:hypothetical protein
VRAVTYNWTSGAVWNIVVELVLLNPKGGCWNWEVEPGNPVNPAGVGKGLIWPPEIPLPNRFPELGVKKFPTVYHNIMVKQGK